MEQYNSTDFYKVSYLIAHGVEPVEKYKMADSNRVVFVFEKNEELVDLLELYDKKQDSTPALAMKSAQREVKDMLFDEDIETREAV